jgi:hypothetical protein
LRQERRRSPGRSYTERFPPPFQTEQNCSPIKRRNYNL